MHSIWDQYREEFPITKKTTYLANAAISPIPKTVYSRALGFYEDVLNNGSLFWESWMDTVGETRELYAKFIGASGPEEIAFTHSTSEGMNTIAHMVSSKGIAILNDLEYPSTNLPWINKNQGNVRFVKSRDGKKILLEDISNMVEDNIKANESSKQKNMKTIVTSHVQFSTGFRQDLLNLGRLASQRNLYFVVNSTQSLGALYLNVREYNIDFMVSSGHKWMLSSFGIGTLFIKKDHLLDTSVSLPPFFSQSGQAAVDRYDINSQINLSSTATRFEVGSPPIQNIFAFNAALKFITKIGIRNIEDRILHLTGYLISKIEGTEFEILSPIQNRDDRSGIIIFRPKNKREPSEIVAELEKKHNVIVSARGKGIRVSPHFYNNEQDIDTLINAVKKICM
jgi:cysteine desulfurase/selenocysteine lyase